ncbi:MAG TPA: aminoglycoside adenylyltransferase domain-containing protein [Anaerolineaceae bacterium]|nr:aminoglycoside adenylyltransferase domain-containing protein [Anaerolineaceae bacterium]
MSSTGWADCPAPVRRQIDQLVRSWQAVLGDALAGLYLHGSLAMGCFNPGCSDVDLLAVTRRAITPAERKRLLEALLDLSNRPAPVEISSLNLEQVRPWRHPAPYELHFSEAWRSGIARELAGEDWRQWRPTGRHDPDLAAHVAVTRTRGLALSGPPPDQLLPAAPEADYLDSIRADLPWARERAQNDPVYAVLNHCRVLAFARGGGMLSKREGGEWALSVLPAAHHPTLRAALDGYTGAGESPAIDAGTLAGFFEYIETEIERAVQKR